MRSLTVKLPTPINGEKKQTLKVAWNQSSESQELPSSTKTASVSVPPGVDFVLTYGGHRQVFPVAGLPKGVKGPFAVSEKSEKPDEPEKVEDKPKEAAPDAGK